MCDKYDSILLNNFYLELFSTDFRNFDSAIQNAKTDYLFEFDSFDDWFECLIKMFVEESMCDETQLRIDINNCHEFLKDMKSEYKELKEICDD